MKSFLNLTIAVCLGLGIPLCVFLLFDSEASRSLGRGEGYAKKKEYDKAIAEYTNAIELEPEYVCAYIRRGFAYVEKTEYDKAIADCTKAIELNSKCPCAYTERGYAYRMKREYDRAIADYTRAIELKPRYVQAYINRAFAYAEKKEYDKAIVDCIRAIELNPKDTWAYMERGYAYKKKREYDRAIADYSRAIELDPKYASAYSNLAWLLATCPEDGVRDGKKAVEHATKACELSEWKNLGKLDTLAAAKAESGDFKDAVKWQKKALDLGYDGNKEAEKARQRLKLYEEGQPYRDK